MTDENLPLELEKQEQTNLIEKAKMLAASDLLPVAFQKKPANCLIALELAKELKLSPLMVMQNIHIIHGKPSLSSSFMIALLHKSADFSSIDFEFKEQNTSCRVVAKKVGEEGALVEGPWVSLEMAKSEGWSTKTGSKWKTMPDLMLRYRAATFFCRTCAPHLLMGFQTTDEVGDVNAHNQLKTRSVTDLLKKGDES